MLKLIPNNPTNPIFIKYFIPKNNKESITLQYIRYHHLSSPQIVYPHTQLFFRLLWMPNPHNISPHSIAQHNYSVCPF